MAKNRDLRDRVAAAARALGRQRYEFGFNGHITVRAEERGTFLVAPWRVSLTSLKPTDLVLVDDEGAILENANGHQVNAFAGNHRFHVARDDAQAVVHLHTPAGFTYSSLGRPLRAVTTDAALVTGLQALHQDFGVQGASPVEALGAEAKVLLQKSHGFITVGSSIEEASFLLIAAERAAQQNLALLDVEGANVLSEQAQDHWRITSEIAEQHFDIYVGQEEQP